MGRRQQETIQEMLSRETPRQTMLDWAMGYKFDRNRARLSFAAHLYAQHRNTLVTTALQVGYKHFIMWPTFEDFRPGGLLALHAWKVRPRAEWVRIFDELSRARRRTVPFPGLGLHHNSNELYYPVPPELVAQAQAFSKRRRAEWRAKHVKGAA